MARIIRFYLGEAPVLPTIQTYWCGDPDQCALVLSSLSEFRVLPRIGERLFGNRRGLVPSQHEEAALRQEIKRTPALFVAQPISQARGRCVSRKAARSNAARTSSFMRCARATASRCFPARSPASRREGSLFTAAGLGGGSKDSWVLSADAEPITLQSRPRRSGEIFLPSRRVTSRVAEVFYWMGRYLERANNLAYLVQVVETLELEELNATERKLYRPMWNRLLPHLEGSGRRSIATPCDRYRLVLQPDEPARSSTCCGGY